MAPRSPGRATSPVSGSMRTRRIPGGTRKGTAGLPSSAGSMKLLKIGAATEEPVSLRPSVLGSSNPANTPTTRAGVKPINQVWKESTAEQGLPDRENRGENFRARVGADM